MIFDYFKTAPGHLLPRTIVPCTNPPPPGQFPPRLIAPRTITPGTTPLRKNCPQIIVPGQFPPRIIDPLDRWPLDIPIQDYSNKGNSPQTIMLLRNFLLSLISPSYKNYAWNKLKHATFVTTRYFININIFSKYITGSPLG